MHISREMIADKKKFLPFFLLQMFLLQKDLKRNKSLSAKILAAQSVDEIDFEEVHASLKKDSQGTLFCLSEYKCVFSKPNP